MFMRSQLRFHGHNPPDWLAASIVGDLLDALSSLLIQQRQWPQEMLSFFQADCPSSSSSSSSPVWVIADQFLIHSRLGGCCRYSNLLEMGEKRKDMLEKSCKKFMLFREANELQQWIHEKESTLTNEEVGSDLEQVEVLQKKFDDFQKVNSVLGSSER